MKRALIFLSLILTWFTGFTQTTIGNQIPIVVKTSSSGSQQNALISLPDDYNVTEQNYPLIIFLHGYGEIGNTTTDLSKLIRQGLPQVIANGAKIQAVNPKDGKLYKFIVLSPQHWGWTTEPASIDYILKTLPLKYRIDLNRVYITGLSAGGQGVVQSVTWTQDLTNKIAAIVPMSPSAPDNSFVNRFKFFTQAKTKAWFLSGSNDTGPYTYNAEKYNDSINKYSPQVSHVTRYPGTHCCWSTYYNPTYKENGKNIYEWMLQYTKGDTTVVEPPIPPTTKKYTLSITLDKLPASYPVYIKMSDSSRVEVKLTVQ